MSISCHSGEGFNDSLFEVIIAITRFLGLLLIWYLKEGPPMYSVGSSATCRFPFIFLQVQKSTLALICSKISAGQTNVPFVKYFRVKGITQMQEVLKTSLNTEITNARYF